MKYFRSVLCLLIAIRANNAIDLARPIKNYLSHPKIPSAQSDVDYNDLAIEKFRTYLQIPSVQPDVNYTGCIAFLNNQAKELGLDYKIYEFTPNKPILVITLNGTDPSLGSIILNSHMDVVIVSKTEWHHDPFGAEVDENGNIYARGSQDTKQLGIQYLEAIRKLLKQGKQFLRDIHITFVTDEENGGPGMNQFVESDQFKDLNVVFALDEGQASPDATLDVYYGQKAIWQVTFHVTGTGGHGSLDLRNTAEEKLRRLLDQIMDYRQSQIDKIDADPNLTVADLTFINLSQVQGGTEPNVVPSLISATFDIRVAVDEDQDKFTALLKEWAAKAGDGIDIEYLEKDPVSPATPLDESNPFWTAMKQVFDSIDQKVITSILPGATDGRFLMRKGIRVLSFSPMNNTPRLLHANDEFLNKDVFLRGIDIFTQIIPAIANVQSD